MGTMIFSMIVRFLALSIRAASITSEGIDSNAFLNMKMPNIATSDGRIRPIQLSTSPSLL